MILPGELLDGYRTIRQIGAGGFGEVWLCRHEMLGHFHALKFIATTDPALVQREFDALCDFRRAGGKLSARAILPIEHINRREDGIFYIMPLTDGWGAGSAAEAEWKPTTLATRVSNQKNAAAWFSSREVRGLMAPVLEALQCLCDAGLVHRDVKPDNILFRSGRPCLGDISLLCEDSEYVTRRGTDGYAAPSWYIESGGHLDMYGAAVTLYVLLTGNSSDKMGRHKFRWPPQGEHSLSEDEKQAWRQLHRVIACATSDDPGERFRSFRQFLKALEEPSPETRAAAGGTDEILPEGTRQEIEALRGELEATRRELGTLRKEFEALINSTLRGLESPLPERAGNADGAGGLAALADRFVAGLQALPAALGLGEKRALVQRALQLAQTISQSHGAGVCEGVERIGRKLGQMLESQHDFHASQIKKVLVQALALARGTELPRPGIVANTTGILLGAVLRAAVSPRKGGLSAETLPESPLLKIIHSANRALSGL